MAQGKRISSLREKLTLLSPYFFWLYLQHIKSLGQGFNLRHSCNLSHGSDDAGVLTHSTTRIFLSFLKHVFWPINLPLSAALAASSKFNVIFSYLKIYILLFLDKLKY